MSVARSTPSTADKPAQSAAEIAKHPVMSLTVEGRTYGVIFGEKQYIVTNNEFIHWLTPNLESSELMGKYPEWKKVALNLREIKERATEVLDIPAFGHYWGIKSRMRDNYDLLKQSMREIGVSTKNMPEFKL